MTPLAEFTFENVEALGPNEAVLFQGANDLAIEISRSLRQTALAGMKQPALNGAIMGMESILQLAYMGKPAIGYPWVLYRNGKRIQSGKTGVNGISGNIAVDMPRGDLVYYKIVVFKPKRN